MRLTVQDASPWSRRKSWNVEFDGEVHVSETHTVLRDTIGVPDRRALDAFLVLFGLGLVLLVAITVGLALRSAASSGHIDLRLPIGAFVLMAVSVGGLIWARIDGEAAAAIDAQLLIRAVGALLSADAEDAS